jgi:hypothetical protein
MIRVSVYGDEKYSRIMKKLLEHEYSDLLERDGGGRVAVDSFVLPEAKPAEPDMPKITIRQFAEAYKRGEVQAVVIPKEYYILYNRVVLLLLQSGVDVNDIYNGIRLFDGIEQRPDCLAQLITPLLRDSYLSYLEYHVADHCNLNCKYCTHYSPLVREPVFADPERVRADLAQVKKYIKDIGVIRILGGEPLLNPRLPEFIRHTRELYPGTLIYVVTNGLLLESISEELIAVMRECVAFFHISYYPPMESRIARMQKFLVEKGIAYTITPLIREFNKTQSLSENPDPDFFYGCEQAICTCLQEGKMAPCYAPYTTKYFNEAFDQELPVNEGIDIYDEQLSMQELKLRLLIPLDRCRYCVAGRAYPWEVVGKNSSLEDWVE